jgi:ribonuclease P/MRP protein subunit POP5|tara:strand:- start:99 stop:431 length:333 start_codon:yes stop_codon:yes gene_type:complete
MNIKPILPSLREKKRYIAYEIISDRKMKFNDVKISINKAVLSFLGELGYAKSGLIIMDTFKNNKGVLRTNHKEVDNIKTSLTLIEKISNTKVMIKSNLVTGVLNKAKKLI